MQNVIVSKKLLFFTPYLGLGLQSWNSTMKLKGTYPVVDDVRFNLAKMREEYIIKDYTDPVSVDATNTCLKATAGFRLKFWVLTLHADYTASEYNVISAGVGFSFGEN